MNTRELNNEGIDPGLTDGIVVIGAGMAGLTAALEAVSQGIDVVVLDKLGPVTSPVRQVPDGVGNETSRAGGGGISRFSAEILVDKLRTSSGDYVGDAGLGNLNPIEILLERHLQRSRGRVDQELIYTYLKNVFNDCCWLRDDVGLPYVDGGRRVKGNGFGLITFLYKAAASKGIKIMFECKAVKLLTEVATGKLRGVRVQAGGKQLDLKARAIVLATGGFEGNEEMMLKYVGPEITYGTVLTGSKDNTGDGHLMAGRVGAQLVNLQTCHIRTTDKLLGIGPSRSLLGTYPLGIYVNQRCQRFLDEGVADSDTIANAIAYQPGSVAALIFDDQARARFPREYEKYPHKEEVIHVAGSIEELANKLRLHPLKLTALIDEFNQAVAGGQAHKLPIPKTANAYKLEQPPFYGFSPVLPGLNHSLGGLKINSKAQVLNREGMPIAGLYAAGSLVNWSFGSAVEIEGITSYQGSYHAGASSGLGTALVFGRIAGRYAAADALAIR